MTLLSCLCLFMVADSVFVVSTRPSINRETPGAVRVVTRHITDPSGVVDGSTTEVATSNSSQAREDIVAKQFLTGPRQPRDVQDMTHAYPWISVGRIYWVLDRAWNRRLVIFWRGNDSLPVLLTGDTKTLSNILVEQYRAGFPGLSHVDEIATLIKDSMTTPAAVIPTEAFCKSQQKFIDGWLRGREKREAEFKKFCTGIRASENGNSWAIQFNVFNTRGGVEVLSARGTVMPFSVNAIEAVTLRPDGEFTYPLSG